MEPVPHSSPQILFSGICRDGNADFKPVILKPFLKEVASSVKSVSMNHNYFCLIYQKLLIRVCDRQIFSPERLFVML